MMKYGDSEEYGNGMRERGCTGKVNESELKLNQATDGSKTKAAAGYQQEVERKRLTKLLTDV